MQAIAVLVLHADLAVMTWTLIMALLMQDLQAEKEDVEKQLCSMRQERNALAATLRQHGSLGRHSLSKAGPVAAQDINGPGQEVPQTVRHEQSEQRGQIHQQRSLDRSCSNVSSTASQQSGHIDSSRQAQADTCSPPVLTHMPVHSPVSSCHARQRNGLSTFEDITNTTGSRQASPGRGYQGREEGTEAMQVKLQRLYDMAQSVLS